MMNHHSRRVAFLITRPMKNIAISNTVIQTRAMKLMAIAKGVGIIGDKRRDIAPSRTPKPPGVKITMKPIIQDNV